MLMQRIAIFLHVEMFDLNGQTPECEALLLDGNYFAAAAIFV